MSSNIINSFEWRLKKLENAIVGQQSEIDLSNNRAKSVFDHLVEVAKLYKSFMSTDGKNYSRFQELMKNKNLWEELDSDISDRAKAEIVLAYEDDLIKYFDSLKSVSDRADRVLNTDVWPDVNCVKGRIEKLETIIKEQHLQSVAIDKQTEELINIYNDIISSFKANTVRWNEKLEAYENNPEPKE